MKRFDFCMHMAVAPEIEAYIIYMSAWTCFAGSAIVTRSPWADLRTYPTAYRACFLIIWAEQ